MAQAPVAHREGLLAQFFHDRPDDARAGQDDFRPLRLETDDGTASVGIAHTSDPRADPVDLLRQADVAMYRAKDSGRDRIETYDRSLDVHISNLRKKLTRGTTGSERIKTVRGTGYLYAVEAN